MFSVDVVTLLVYTVRFCCTVTVTVVAVRLSYTSHSSAAAQVTVLTVCMEL